MSPAVPRARRAYAFFVDIRKPGRHGDAVADVRKNFAAPVGGNFGDELLAISGRAPRVRHEHHVTIVRPNLRIPPVTPVVVPAPLRAALNQTHHRLFSPPLAIPRLDHPPPTFAPPSH